MDPTNTFIVSSVLYNLTSETNVTIVDCSGSQDLVTAQVLQLTIGEHSAPVIFKHPSLDEMKNWLAAFCLALVLGETGSICSDTDSSATGTVELYTCCLYYNEQLDFWEPLLESIEDIQNYRTWQANVDNFSSQFSAGVCVEQY